MELTWQTVRRAAGSDKMNYRHKRVQSVSQAGSPSVSQSKWAGLSCEFPKRAATLYQSDWGNNPNPPQCSGKHLTDPLAIAIAARAQWMFNDLLIGFWLFTPQQRKTKEREKKKVKRAGKTLSLFICTGITHTGKLFKRCSSIFMRCINVQIPWGRRGQGLSAWRRSDSQHLMMANCYANCIQKRTFCCPFSLNEVSKHVDGGIIYGKYWKIE